ncbi:MAG: penicillin acylase family protein [Pacificimonas sp.]
MGKFFTGVVIFAVIIAIGLMIWEPLTARGSAPPPEREYDVRILRDNFGVPHVYGRTDADVAYGTAWAHAEDDFTTLVDVALQTKGRYASLAGMDGAAIDYIYNLLGARETARRGYPQLSADTRAFVDAYAAGLNDYAEAHPQEVKRAGVFPLNGEDVVAGFVLRAPFFYGLDGTLRPLIDGEEPPRPPSAQVVDHSGSNAFAVSASASPDDTTRLIVNSHQPWTGPVAWYEVRQRSEEGLDFAGALFPGSPVLEVGHNANLGYGRTVNRPDLIDTYKLVLDDSGERYRFGDEWRTLESERIWLKIGFGPFVIPVPRTIYRSVHGPIIKNDLGAFAVRYAGIDDARWLEQALRLSKTTNLEEWREAMAMQAVHGTNYVYADDAGNVGLVYNASFPKRQPGYDWAGILPGDDPDALWTDYVTPAEVPTLFNPPSGFVANANNQPWQATLDGENLMPDDWAPELGVEVRTTNRSLRMLELANAEEDRTWSREELLTIKFDKGYSKDPRGWPAQWWARVMAADAPSETMALLQRWDWTLDGAGDADALALLVMQDGALKGYRGLAFEDASESVTDAASLLMETFGRLDPPLSELVRVQRGMADEGIVGGPDALRALYFDEGRDGRVQGVNGDGFIMLVEWGPDGLNSESIHQYGAATNRPESPHYSDQAALFAAEGWKPVRLDEADLRAHLTREYRPGNDSAE